MKTQRILSIFCREDGHQFCIGKSAGDRDDKVNIECACHCHTWNGGSNKAKTDQEYKAGIESKEYQDWCKRNR